MEFIFGRAGAALLSPCHGEGQDVRRGQCHFPVTARCAPRAMRFSCHGKIYAAGSAIFLSRQDVHRGQCDFPVTAKCTLRAGRRRQCNFSCHGKMYAVGGSPQAVRFSCHGKMYAAGNTIFVSRRLCRRGQCNFSVTARCAPRAVPFSCHGKMYAAGRKQTAAPSGYAGFRRLSASIQNACPRKARASGILNRFAAPTIPHAVLTTTKTAPKAIKLW